MSEIFELKSHKPGIIKWDPVWANQTLTVWYCWGFSGNILHCLGWCPMMIFANSIHYADFRVPISSRSFKGCRSPGRQQPVAEPPKQPLWRGLFLLMYIYFYAYIYIYTCTPRCFLLDLHYYLFYVYTNIFVWEICIYVQLDIFLAFWFMSCRSTCCVFQTKCFTVKSNLWTKPMTKDGWLQLRLASMACFLFRGV